MGPNLVRYPSGRLSVVKQVSGGGLLLHRHVTPLPRRYVVYFCSGAHTPARQDESGPRYARMVPVDEIANPKNDYNLNLPRYIDSTEPEDLQDIDGHLRGGIPERDIDDPLRLKPYWDVLPSVRAVLFKGADRPGYPQRSLPDYPWKALPDLAGSLSRTQ